MDFNTDGMRLFHCGASSRDAGKRITTITEIQERDVYMDVIKALMENQALVLK